MPLNDKSVYNLPGVPWTPAMGDITDILTAQQGANTSAASATAQQNRPNQYNPFGSLTWTQGGNNFDKGGYDAAYKAWQTAGGAGQAPTKETFGFDPMAWQSTSSLSPELQSLWSSALGGFRTNLGKTSDINLPDMVDVPKPIDLGNMWNSVTPRYGNASDIMAMFSGQNANTQGNFASMLASRMPEYNSRMSYNGAPAIGNSGIGRGAGGTAEGSFNALASSPDSWGAMFNLPSGVSFGDLGPRNMEANLSGINSPSAINTSDLGPRALSADFSGVSNLPTAAGFNADTLETSRKRIEDALYQSQTRRLDPRFAQSEDALRSRLANQGITEGSEAFNRAMTQFAQDKNDAYQLASGNAIQMGGQELDRALQEEQRTFDRGMGVHQQGISDAMGIFDSNLAARSQALTEKNAEFSSSLASAQALADRILGQFQSNLSARGQALAEKGTEFDSSLTSTQAITDALLKQFQSKLAVRQQGVNESQQSFSNSLAARDMTTSEMDRLRASGLSELGLFDTLAGNVATRDLAARGFNTSNEAAKDTSASTAYNVMKDQGQTAMTNQMTAGQTRFNNQLSLQQQIVQALQGMRNGVSPSFSSDNVGTVATNPIVQALMQLQQNRGSIYNNTLSSEVSRGNAETAANTQKQSGILKSLFGDAGDLGDSLLSVFGF